MAVRQNISVPRIWVGLKPAVRASAISRADGSAGFCVEAVLPGWAVVAWIAAAFGAGCEAAGADDAAAAFDELELRGTCCACPIAATINALVTNTKVRNLEAVMDGLPM